MKVLESKSMIERELNSLTWLPPTNINLRGYQGLTFECGCGEAHYVSGADGALPLMTSPPVKVLFNCPNGSVTFVHIKGLFRQTAISLWTCDAGLFE